MVAVRGNHDDSGGLWEKKRHLLAPSRCLAHPPALLVCSTPALHCAAPSASLLSMPAPACPAAYEAFRAWLDGRDIPKARKQGWVAGLEAGLAELLSQLPFTLQARPAAAASYRSCRPARRCAAACALHASAAPGAARSS